MTILVYAPKGKFKEWLYGWDIIQWVMNCYPQINWIRVTGNSDMNTIYPKVDAYIRPTRHDGDPLMLQECKQRNIPYYWSVNGKPEVHEIIDFIEGLK